MLPMWSRRRDDAATINRIVRRQATGVDGQRKGVSNYLQNCTNEFEIFIDPMTTQATMHGKRKTLHLLFIHVIRCIRVAPCWHAQHLRLLNGAANLS